MARWSRGSAAACVAFDRGLELSNRQQRRRITEAVTRCRPHPSFRQIGIADPDFDVVRFKSEFMWRP